MTKTNGLKLGLAGLALAGQVNAADINSEVANTLDNTKNTISNHIRVYGAGDKISDKTYNGVGFEFENNNVIISAEKGPKITKGTAIGKIGLGNGFYSKLGTGYLQKETSIEGINKNVDQLTLGGALGYGNEQNYNIEAGYISSKLNNAGNADSTARTTYVEGIVKEDTKVGGFDLSGTYENTNVYGKNYSDYSASAGYYPTEDIRAGVNYSSIDHNSNDYSVKAGVNYKFDWSDLSKGAFTPFLRASKNISKNVSATLEYRDDIQDKVLSMRDTFEETVSTSNFVAKQVAPTEFTKKVEKQVVNNVPEVSPTSWMTIPDASVDDTGSTNTEKLVLDDVKSYIENYNGTDPISVVGGDGKFKINSNDQLVWVGGDITGNGEDYTLELKVGNVASNSFNVHVNNVQ